MDTGDTAWMLMSTALVMIMLPGLALFYGGLVRSKNVLSTVMHSFFGLALVSVVWVLIGFTLAFGPDVGGLGLIGGLDFAMFNGVGLQPNRRLRHDDSVRAVCVIPADVRGDHPGPHHRRVRRAQAVRRLRPLHDPVVDSCLLSARPLGLVERWLARQARRARLRRRHGRSHQLGRLGARRRAAHRPTDDERRGDRPRTTCR